MGEKTSWVKVIRMSHRSGLSPAEEDVAGTAADFACTAPVWPGVSDRSRIVNPVCDDANRPQRSRISSSVRFRRRISVSDSW